MCVNKLVGREAFNGYVTVKSAELKDFFPEVFTASFVSLV